MSVGQSSSSSSSSLPALQFYIAPKPPETKVVAVKSKDWLAKKGKKLNDTFELASAPNLIMLARPSQRQLDAVDIVAMRRSDYNTFKKGLIPYVSANPVPAIFRLHEERVAVSCGRKSEFADCVFKLNDGSTLPVLAPDSAARVLAQRTRP